ncbi:hypothetical protein [Streptomyces tendae]|uniref:hypothetical protein n=1 Tax=Streptomyces tendae TaxID=1932 RepID=UPI00368127F2
MARKDVDVVVTRSTDVEIPATRQLERGWKKAQLVRYLALGEITQEKLGEIFGVSQAAVSRFKTRHTAEIEMAKIALAEQAMSGMEHLYIAQKVNRVAELEETVNRMNEIDSARSHEVKIHAIRSVAEEMGQLPARTQVNVSNETTVYEIVGLDADAI